MAAIRTKENERDLARHVKRREQRAGAAEIKRNLRHRPAMRGMENFVLAPEAGEEQRKARERQHADGVSRERQRHEFFQSAHFADVLFLMAAVDDRAGTEEQQRLEKSVRDEMKHADRHAADAEAHHHVTKLRNSGVSEDAFDVVLRDGDARGKNRGDGTNPSDDGQRSRNVNSVSPYDAAKGHERRNRGAEA